jgi:tetratricopeptide (TPR) repeat protein
MTRHRIVLLAALVLLLVVAVFSGCRSAHTTSAILYIEQEQYQKAIDVIDEGLQYNPDDPEGFYYQGEAYSRMAQQAIDENEYRRAKSAFENAYGKYTHAREMAPDDQQLVNQVDESLEINYRNTLREGKAMWKDAHYEEAEGFFRLAFAALPDSLDSMRNLASMKIQHAELLASDEPDSAAMLREDALDLLDQVLAENPDAYRLRADKAYVLTQLDRTDEAQAIYEVLLAEHGDDPELLLDVIGLYSKQNRYQDAGDLFMRVADIYLNDTDPSNDDQVKGLYREAGFNYQNAANYPDALEAYSLASEQDVNDTQIMSYRVQMHMQYGQELLMQAAEASATNPQRSAQLEAEGRATLQRGVDVGNALVAMAPNDAYAFLYLAQIQAMLGDTDASAQNMQTYEELSGTQ